MGTKPNSQQKELMKIPGVGIAVSRDLLNIGIQRIAELKGRDPQQLYDDICAYQGTQVDRCMLYVMRCAVYFASNESHDSEKLEWWNWMNK